MLGEETLSLFHLPPAGEVALSAAWPYSGLACADLTQLVHCFDWELPSGMLPIKLNMRRV